MSTVGLPQFSDDNLAEFSVACGEKCGVSFTGKSTSSATTSSLLRKYGWRFRGTRWVCPGCLELAK